MRKKESKKFNAFEKLYKQELTEYEKANIKNNLFGFLELLIEIDKEQKEDDRYNSVNNSKK
jgi:hypothetical protein